MGHLCPRSGPLILQAPGLSRLRRDVVMESLLQGVNQKWDSLMAGTDTAGKVLRVRRLQ